MLKPICLLILLITITNNLHSQDRCYSFTNGSNPVRLNPIIDKRVKYKISTGLCYHYNSTSIDIGYKRNYLSLTFMNPNPHRSTMRMKEEIYIGYTYDLPIGRKGNVHIGITPSFEITSHEPVGRLYIDRRVYKGFFIHGSTIQVGTRMNHLIGGIKLFI
jgi:hypothetical protein